jgi:EAL domain-containing protein (putative c-di-GMP-specific phosphodiesterase class I)/CheY-like chemotaxis protein
MARHLLILDDDAEIGQFVRQVAERIGFSVTSVTSFEAFRLGLAEREPDEIVLDLHLGRADGIEVLRFLAGQGCGARITMMSGTDARALQSARQLAIDLGLSVGEALLKPVRVTSLREALALPQAQPAQPTATELSNGIANGELFLEYQPIVVCATGALACLEALVRWARPEVGRIMPNDFIPLAEADADLMDRLTFAVAERAALDWPILERGGFAGRIGLNISAQNLRRLDFPERLDETLREHGLSAERVKLEVTETAAMSDPLVQIDVLLRLHLRGFVLVIDDFGTGYSSLSMLRRLPYSELKIDRSFVQDLRTSRDSMAVVRAALALAQSMGLSTVAEGVEDSATLDSLTGLGVTFAQGYGVGRPIAPTKVEEWIRAQRRPLHGDPQDDGLGSGRSDAKGRPDDRPPGGWRH